MSQKKQHKQKESFFNLHFTATISIALVLTMIGLTSLIFQSAKSLSDRTQQSLCVALTLDDSIAASDFTRIHKYVNAAPFIDHTVYISKDSALAEHMAMVGENPVDFLGYNPLKATIELYLNEKYAHVDSIEKVVLPRIKAFSGITSINYQEEMFEMLETNISRLTILFSAITLILLLISIVLINNTIRISIYSKRFIINTMQLVGAKNGFIRKPFVRRAMVNALIAALIAIAALAGLVYLASIQFSVALTLGDIMRMLPSAGIVIVLSFAINYFATLAAVNRYLRLTTNQLYFI